MAENSAPAKIWATPTRETYSAPIWDRGEFYEDERHADGFGVKYVRADYHDKLVEALKAAAASAGFQYMLPEVREKIDAALASLQTQEEGGV